MTTRKTPSVRSLLASTTPNAPYAVAPTRAELLDALRTITAAAFTVSLAPARDLLQRDEVARRWFARVDALRSCILSHDLKVTPPGVRQLRACPCATCGGWRRELNAMYEDKAAKATAVNI